MHLKPDLCNRNLFEGNIPGWDSVGTQLSNLWSNLMSKTNILKVLSNAQIKVLALEFEQSSKG